MKTIRIGCGAGFSGDRIEPAVELADAGRSGLPRLRVPGRANDRPGAAGQSRATRNAGYDPLLEARMEAVLPACVDRGVTIITNMGAANPAAAARRGAAMSRGGWAGAASRSRP